jgi:hypothetical protein
MLRVMARFGMALVVAASAWGCGDHASSAPDAAADLGAPSSDAAAPDVSADTALPPDVAAADVSSLDAVAGIDGSKEAMLKLDRTAADFKPAILHCPPAETIVFAVRNVGRSPSGTLTVEVGKPFEVLAEECSGQALAANQECGIAVQYRPEAMGAHVASLVVKATPGGEVMGTLRGSAAFGDFVKPVGSLQEFGSVAVGAMSAARTLGLKNISAMPLPIKEVTISPADFVVTRDGCSGKTVPPDTTCEVDAAFKPGSRGLKRGQLTIEATACTTHAVGFDLTGTGT